MFKEIVERFINHFNDNNLEEVMKIHHDDVKLFRLKTQSILLEGKPQLKEMYSNNMNVMKVKIKLHNLLEFNNIVVIFSEIINTDRERISIVEFKDDKIFRIWASSFNKEKDYPN